MPNQGKPLSRFLAVVMFCGSVGFVGASFMPLWKTTARITFQSIGGDGATFWQFLDEFPAEAGIKEAKPVLGVVASTFLRGNVSTTLLVLAGCLCVGLGARVVGRRRDGEGALPTETPLKADGRSPP